MRQVHIDVVVSEGSQATVVELTKEEHAKAVQDVIEMMLETRTGGSGAFTVSDIEWLLTEHTDGIPFKLTPAT